jgi:hypothetical protein
MDVDEYLESIIKSRKKKLKSDEEIDKKLDTDLNKNFLNKKNLNKKLDTDLDKNKEVEKNEQI